MLGDKLIFEEDTSFGHYKVVDMKYGGRPARVLYSGRSGAAQSGLALDQRPKLLFDYNQRFLELVCGLRPASLLLIGGGAYTLPMALLGQLPGLNIDVVERDSFLLTVAERYFGLKSDNRLVIIHQDGLGYLRSTNKRYDLVLLDVFSGGDLVEEFTSLDSARLVKKRLSRGGVVAMNTISAYSGRQAQGLKRQINDWQTVFKTVDTFPADSKFSAWTPQNLLVIGQKDRAKPLQQFLRFGSLSDNF